MGKFYVKNTRQQFCLACKGTKFMSEYLSRRRNVIEQNVLSKIQLIITCQATDILITAVKKIEVEKKENP